ncbi:2-C-methyl-D-erythritol 4-phosphate cytidylyltransferase [Alteromonas sp. a30]|nr:2-C-methyl-D-erythritol 4-phosphate cytidylyltransferase [Alteromonas sp. a30]
MIHSADPLPQFSAIVPAAGVGKRMKTNIPKQYLTLLNKSLLEWTLATLISHPQIKHILVAINPNDEYFGSLKIAKSPWLTRIDGGKERSDSVLAGLQHLQQTSENFDSEWALVHDAARPCVSHHDISQLLALHGSGCGGILATPVRDTMKRSEATSSSTPLVNQTVERDNLWHALTPQFFPAQELLQALEMGLNQGRKVTDEASAIEFQKGSVKLVEGCSSNIKVTHPQDLKLAEFYIKNRGTYES